MIFSGWFKQKKRTNSNYGNEWEIGERPIIPNHLVGDEITTHQLFEKILSRLDDIERKIEAMGKKDQ